MQYLKVAEKCPIQREAEHGLRLRLAEHFKSYLVASSHVAVKMSFNEEQEAIDARQAHGKGDYHEHVKRLVLRDEFKRREDWKLVSLMKIRPYNV